MRRSLAAALAAIVGTTSSSAHAFFYVDWIAQGSYSRTPDTPAENSRGTGGPGGGPVMRVGLEYGGITRETKGTHINVGAYGMFGIGYKAPKNAEDENLWGQIRIEPFLRVIIAINPDTDLALGGAASTGFDNARARFGAGTGAGHAQYFGTGGVRHGDFFVEGGLGRGEDTNSARYTFIMGQGHYNFEGIPTFLGFPINQLGVRVESLTDASVTHVIAQGWLGTHF